VATTRPFPKAFPRVASAPRVVTTIDIISTENQGFVMPVSTSQTAHQWLSTGDGIFAAMLSAIDSARSSVCLEIYIFAPGPCGERFRDAFVRAQMRGVQVRVLIDAFGSMGLPDSFWEPLRAVGGEVRSFNPAAWMRFSCRDHRKLLVCDERVAFVGGFNIASEYVGDGVRSGWRDLGVKLEGSLAISLASSFAEMFARAEFRHKHLALLRRFAAKRPAVRPTGQIFLSEPGPGRNQIKLSVHRDLVRAREVQIIAGYFLPTSQLRRDLVRLARRGAKVQLILAGKSDVWLSQLAAQSLYRRFLKAGVEIFEYQPQILHAKLIIIDQVVYAGSSNLDPRSLRINFELMIRFQNRVMAGEAREIFAGDLKNCHRIELDAWSKSRNLWRRLKQRVACLLLMRIDPFLASKPWRALPD